MSILHTVLDLSSGVLRLMGLYGPALNVLDRVLALDSKNALALRIKGQVLMALKQPQEAVAALQQASTLTTDLSQVHVELSAALRALGRYEEALAALERALESKPQDAKTLSAKGEVLRILGRYTDALAALDQALALKGNDPYALATKGQVLRALKRNDEAATALLRAVELDPKLELSLIHI